MIRLNTRIRYICNEGTISKPYLAGLLLLLAIIISPNYSKASTSDSEHIASAEKAIQNISTLQANFTQISSDGSYAVGTLYFRRPFQMRLEYNLEEPYNLITTRKWLIVDEPANKKASNYPISETPFAPLLKDTVSLIGDDFSTTSRMSDGLVEIKLRKDAGENPGELILLFEPNDMNLRGWIVIDTLGVKTKVTLQNEIYGRELANKLFGKPLY